ncbi:hypothetical protein Hanom_Chr01g00052951 [Helianthus anomalus]
MQLVVQKHWIYKFNQLKSYTIHQHKFRKTSTNFPPLQIQIQILLTHHHQNQNPQMPHHQPLHPLPPQNH